MHIQRKFLPFVVSFLGLCAVRAQSNAGSEKNEIFLNVNETSKTDLSTPSAAIILDQSGKMPTFLPNKGPHPRQLLSEVDFDSALADIYDADYVEAQLDAELPAVTETETITVEPYLNVQDDRGQRQLEIDVDVDVDNYGYGYGYDNSICLYYPSYCTGGYGLGLGGYGLYGGIGGIGVIGGRRWLGRRPIGGRLRGSHGYRRRGNGFRKAGAFRRGGGYRRGGGFRRGGGRRG